MASFLGQFKSGRGIVRALVSTGFIASGILHFVAPDSYAKIVPPALPAPLTLVYISGACEILGGIGLLFPNSRKFSAFGLIALLIAVFPANLYQAVANLQLGGFMNSPGYQWGRLPFQGLFIWAVLWSSNEPTTENIKS